MRYLTAWYTLVVAFICSVCRRTTSVGPGPAVESLLSQASDVSLLIQLNSDSLGTTNFVNPVEYSVVTGIFVQDDDDYNPDENDVLHESFGLKDTSSDRWRKLINHINELNESSDDQTAYKLIFIARHGEGVHNVAEAKYGTPAWNAYWSKLYGDGTLVWGPDPALTTLGMSQAEDVNVTWKKEMKDGIPLPASFYSSPLQRATNTLEITWQDIQLNRNITPLIMEDWRESIGTHTCDQRSTRTAIAKLHPGWQFNTGFTEADELWKPPYEETDAEHDYRTRRALDYIFSTDSSACISITAHGGSIHSFFDVTQHQIFQPHPGGVVPVLVKAQGLSNNTMKRSMEEKV